MSSDATNLSDGQLDAAYGASFNVGDRSAMNYYAQEILSREGSGVVSAIRALWDGATSSPRFPIFDSLQGQVPPTPGLNPSLNSPATDFVAGNEAVKSVQQAAAPILNDLKIGGLTIGGIAIILIVIALLLRFGK